MPPTVTVSAPTGGQFTVTVSALVPGTHTIELPAGTYEAGHSFVGANTAQNGRGLLNVYVPGAEAFDGLQILQRFRIGCFDECWQEHALRFTLDEPTEVTVYAWTDISVESVPPTEPPTYLPGCAFLLKFDVRETL